MKYFNVVTLRSHILQSWKYFLEIKPVKLTVSVNGGGGQLGVIEVLEHHQQQVGLAI